MTAPVLLYYSKTWTVGRRVVHGREVGESITVTMTTQIVVLTSGNRVTDTNEVGNYKL